MSAERLREASALIRSAVEQAPSQTAVAVKTKGVWLGSRHYLTTTAARQLTVADWLDSVADSFEPPDGSGRKGRSIAPTDERAALAIADAYLGGRS